MAEIYCKLQGKPVKSLRALIPNKGAWYADVDLGDVVDLSGSATIEVGTLKLVGTIDPKHSGTFGQSTKVRVLAGNGGWSNEVEAKDYHNDARVKARTVAEDAARAVGETLGSFLPTAERVGVDFVRIKTAASVVLEQAIGKAAWWVGYDGKTNVGPRPEVKPGTFELIAYDVEKRIATLTADDPIAVGIGAKLEDERLGGAQVVRQVELTVDDRELRIYAWCGGSETSEARIARAISSIANHSTVGKVFGLWPYRVVKMSGDRVELQALSPDSGVPNLLPIDMRCGVPGVWSRLTPGAEVVVGFLEGSVTKPTIVSFSPKGGSGFVPVEIVIGDDASALYAARRGDLVQCGGAGTMCTLTGPAAPPNGAVIMGAPYQISFSVSPMPQAPLYGAIMTGSQLLRTK